MNRLLPIFILLVSFNSNSQAGTVTIDGFRELKIGQPLSITEKYLTPTEVVPEYAWFATPEFDYFKKLMNHADSDELSGEDSMRIEMAMEMAYLDCDGQSYVPKHEDYQTIHGFTIEAIRICSDDGNTISAVYIVINKRDIDEESKEMIKTLFSADLGIEYCEESIIGSSRPFPFTCFQYDGEREAVISDMYAEGAGFGESINIVFR